MAPFLSYIPKTMSDKPFPIIGILVDICSLCYWDYVKGDLLCQIGHLMFKYIYIKTFSIFNFQFPTCLQRKTWFWISLLTFLCCFFWSFFFFRIVQKLKFVLWIDVKNNHFYTTFQQLYIPKKFIGQLMLIKLSN